MPQRLSAINCVSPAFEQAKQQLFKPFRFRHWLRLAAVCLVTGDFAGGGGWSGGNFNVPSPQHKRTATFLALAAPGWEQFRPFLVWILLGVALLFGLLILWLYAASVYRFILFDAVLYNRCELRKGWHRWEKQGSSYFLFIIALGLGLPTTLLLLIGGPIFFVWRAGVFRHPGEHLVLLILGGFALVLLFFAVILAGALVGLFAKDFAVPLMALEDLGMMDAWRRMSPMLAAEKGAFAGYVLMKIVLAVGSAILFGIITVLAVLALLIPLGILGLVIFLIARAGGATWNLTTISAVVLLGCAALTALFYVVAFVSTPAMVFFQSYTLHFFGSRYARLGDVLFGTPPPEPHAPPAPAT